MPAPVLTLRVAVPADLSGVDRLLGRSYPRLLAPDYPPSTLVLAVPRFARAQPALLASGRYFVAEDALGIILAAGGWSRGNPGGGPLAEATGHIRHVATDPSVARQGVGQMLMARVIEDARAEGMRWLDCLSTTTAVPFYRKMGFVALGSAELPLGAGIGFAVMRMRLEMS
jgi:GNAT superfamily N-acetyltransferase